MSMDLEQGWYGTCTDEDGNYTITSVPFGTHNVVAGRDFCGPHSYIEQTIYGVTLTEVEPDVVGLDFTLQLGGSISGTVTDEFGNPIADRIDVSACLFTDDSICWWTSVQPDGSYIIYSLPTEVYRVHTYPINGGYWLDEWFDDTRDWSMANPVSVTAGFETPDINFSLQLGGSISGNVSDAHGPVAYVWVDACNWDDTFCNSAETDENGGYTIYSLPGGDYRVSVWGGQGGWLDQFYNNKRLHENADPVSVTVGANTGGIDFFMDPAGSISGNVSDAHGPVAYVWVDACNWNDTFCNGTETDENGDYTIYSLPGGDYRVNVWGGQGGWLDQYYDHVRYWDLATPVAVTVGIDTGGIDFDLESGGSISGWVTDASGNPIEGLDVSACGYDDPEPFCMGVNTHDDGSYIIGGLPAGDYRVSIFGSGWAREYYDDTDRWYEATRVPVTEGLITSGIDFDLEPGGSISGRVTDEYGNPLVNMSMDLEQGWYGTCADEDGYYTIVSVPFGAHNVVAGRDFCGPHTYMEQTIYGVTLTEVEPDVVGLDFTLYPE
jgi:hypothetical protein